MKKRLIFILLLVLEIILFLALYESGYPPKEKQEESQNLTGDLATLRTLKAGESDIRTIAICNRSNFCQDYKIICSEGEVIEKTPVENATVQHLQSWKDARGIDYENLCR